MTKVRMRRWGNFMVCFNCKLDVELYLFHYLRNNMYIGSIQTHRSKRAWLTDTITYAKDDVN